MSKMFKKLIQTAKVMRAEKRVGRAKAKGVAPVILKVNEVYHTIDLSHNIKPLNTLVQEIVVLEQYLGAALLNKLDGKAQSLQKNGSHQSKFGILQSLKSLQPEFHFLVWQKKAI